MKTLLKIVVGLVVLLLIVAACGYGYLLFAYPKVPPPPTVTFDAIARTAGAWRVPGRARRRLRDLPHASATGRSSPARSSANRSGAGGEPFDLGPAGVLYSKNITPAGIGSWTDGELLRAVTQGVSKDGTPLFPLMPYPHFGAMSEDDVHAVLAYVRSWKAIEDVSAGAVA